MINRKDIETLCPSCFREKGNEPVCPHCAYDERRHDRYRYGLPARTVLEGTYMVGRLLGKGGWAITYLGLDQYRDVKVAIKEYFPQEVANRKPGQTTVRHEQEAIFRQGLERFLDEARMLSRIKNPNVGRIHSIFEANNTAYLVMPYYEGKTLSEYLHAHGDHLTPHAAMHIMLPVLDGLRDVHESRMLHNDIKPQNIILTNDGYPILLNFRKARSALSEMNRNLTPVWTSGYTPFEQYHRKGNLGPWTDIYAAAATLYRMVTGEVPPPAPNRIREDTLIPPDQLNPGISPQLSEALTQSLALAPEQRPQTVRDFQEMLFRALRFERVERMDPPPVKENPSRREPASAITPSPHSELDFEPDVADLEARLRAIKPPEGRTIREGDYPPVEAVRKEDGSWVLVEREKPTTIWGRIKALFF